MYLYICFTHVKLMLNICGFKHVFNTCGHFSCVFRHKMPLVDVEFVIFIMNAHFFVCFLHRQTQNHNHKGICIHIYF